MTDKMRCLPHCDHHKPKESAMNTLLKPLAIAALLVATLTSAAVAQSQGTIMPDDNGRWHGYMPSGYIGAHPSNRALLHLVG